MLGETQGVVETWARKLLLLLELLLRCRLSVRRRFRGEDEGRSRRDEASFDVAGVGVRASAVRVWAGVVYVSGSMQ